jgi:hypothetical protein
MARIRTIKPDFWSDEKLTECSMSARLFFIGLWNFADDNGNLARSAKKLKMQIFPADAVDCEPLVQELLGIGVLVEYDINGDKFLHIKGFKKHQVINRPSKSQIPQAPFIDESIPSNEDSLNTHGVLTDGREKEGKGKEKEEPSNTDVLLVISDAADQVEEERRKAERRSDCPHQQIIDLYHEILPTCPSVRDWTPARAALLRARWNEDAKRQTLTYWRDFFEYVATCDFLVGRSKGKPFFASLPWLVKQENFAKVREGNYENKVAA